MPIAKQKKTFSPVVHDRGTGSVHNKTAVKRKQADGEVAPPAKRQQLNGNTKLDHTITRPSDRPQFSRKLSESERSSSPDKAGNTRNDVVDKAKRFQLYYKKYKAIHDKISSVPEKERSQEEMDKLWGMHKRLQDMKATIWTDWEKVE
jgi:hypothetical protein